MSLGPWEIALIILAIIILFGGKKLPELARGLGLGLKEFKKAKGVGIDIDKKALKVAKQNKDNLINEKRLKFYKA